MSFGCPERMPLVLALVAAAALSAACEREKREFAKPLQPPAAVDIVSIGQLPGGAGPGLEETAAPAGYDERNAYDIAQGKRLFRWYNCSGCHANGGGGMGPALMDAGWRYGHEPQQVFATIMGGRPNGMPSFRGRIPEEQAWQIVAYVRSISGQVPNASMSGRNDALSSGEPEPRREPEEPRRELPPKPP